MINNTILKITSMGLYKNSEFEFLVERCEYCGWEMRDWWMHKKICTTAALKEAKQIELPFNKSIRVE
jgi:hypothetical protein